MSSKNTSSVPEVTWAQAARDVIIHFVDKGLLLALIFCGIIFMILFKISTSTADKILSDFLYSLKEYWLWGYILFIGALVLWNRHITWVRKEFEKEIERIGEEKTKIQNIVAKREFDSSKK